MIQSFLTAFFFQTDAMPVLTKWLNPSVFPGSVSLIFNPFLSFLPSTPPNPLIKEGVNQVQKKWTSPIVISTSLESGLPMDQDQ